MELSTVAKDAVRQLGMKSGRPGYPCFVVAEVAQGHDGSLGMAHAYIDAVASAGADAVKFQTHLAAAESTPGEPWRVKFSPQDASRYDYWKRMEFTEDEWNRLKKHADERGLKFLSSPFSVEAVELLRRVGVAAWKVAGGKARGLPFDVLQCTSAYPCPPDKVGVNLILFFRERYDCGAGLSDHSGTIYPGLAAAFLGMEVLEVDVTLSREVFNPDVPASIPTTGLRQLVDGIRFVERMNANPIDKNAMAAEMAPLRSLFTKSIVARIDLPTGTPLQAEHLTLKKPGTGIRADRLPELIGRTLRRSVKADQLLQESDLA
jgi:N,N'-diacetyllegionaminate synthase